MNYKIAVTSVNFDKNYDNVIRFNSKTERNAYFNIPAIFEDVPVCNFNASSLLRTSVTARFDAATDLTQLLMSNYCIVQNVEKPEEIYFYFVLSAEQKSGTTIQLQLELDIFQTFYLDVSFSDCMINRAHLDRFNEEVEEDSNGAYVTFKSGDTDDNMLYQSEEIEDPPLRIVSRKHITWDIFPNNPAANSFISEHVIAWIYCYVAANENFTVISGETPKTYGDNYPGLVLYRQKSDTAPVISLFDYTEGYITPSRILVCPIVENGYNIKIGSKNWNTVTMQEFIQYASPYIHSIKLSLMPPFYKTDINGDQTSMSASVSGNTLTINIPSFDLGAAPDVNYVNTVSFNNTNSVALKVLALPMKPQEGYVTLEGSEKINALGRINVSDIVGTFTHDPKLNPKMYSEAYKELQISTPDGQTYAYSQQKLGVYGGEIRIKYIENLTADTTRIYAYIDNNDEDTNLYTELMGKSYVGALTSGDFSMPYASDQLQEYLAQNKNFYEQTKLNAAINFGQSATSSLINISKSALKGSIAGPVGAAIGGVVGLINFASNLITGGMQMTAAYQNMEYTADNLRSAPDKLKNASGSAIFNVIIRDFKLCVDEYLPLKSDQIRINDMMHRYGYTVQRIGKIKNYDNIRHYFNFVMAEVEEVLSDTVNISLDVRDMFKQAFAHGVRFWNPSATMYDFDPENYEERLAEYAKEETAA